MSLCVFPNTRASAIDFIITKFDDNVIIIIMVRFIYLGDYN